jgi:hypothetical protein
MKTLEMEIALANYFRFFQNIVVPNVSYGMGLHECDLLIMTGTGYLIEVEIKVSKQDLLAERKKRHGHRSNKIKKLYFAVPVFLADFALEHIPDRAGLIVVYERWKGRYDCSVIKRAKSNEIAVSVDEAERYRLTRLGAIRLWSIKKKLLKLTLNKKNKLRRRQ